MTPSTEGPNSTPAQICNTASGAIRLMPVSRHSAHGPAINRLA
jgi:hypothetical protein